MQLEFKFCFEMVVDLSWEWYGCAMRCSQGVECMKGLLEVQGCSFTRMRATQLLLPARQDSSGVASGR